MENKLKFQSSPYLQQHQDNPIWWQPWGPDAFATAAKKNKPIFLSIGYSTCHWCHVMEKDSFEKQDVADVLNKHFVSIKVDREERPDVDAIYMAAVQAMTGHGGWPMSVLLTPEGHPFWAGTFLPHSSFLDLLSKVVQIWEQSPEALRDNGAQVTTHLNQLNQQINQEVTLSTGPLKAFYQGMLSRFDKENGGHLGAPKFPAAFSLMLLLRYHHRSKNDFALKMTDFTLTKMAEGGIFDQVGGGFHRYSVDDHWLVPHFEKMLYDNALLSCALLETYQVTGNSFFLQTAQKTLDYVARDLRDSRGGFYSAEDADSEGIEGKFYVWGFDEIKSLLSEAQWDEFQKAFIIHRDGNFETHKTGDEMKARVHNLPPALVANVLSVRDRNALANPLVTQALKILFEKRSQRKRPHLDHKIVASWNGLMISSFAKGALFDSKYLDFAAQAGEFAWSDMQTDGKWHRTWCDGRKGPWALCEDYACLIQSYLDLFEATLDETWLTRAKTMQAKQDSLFWDQGYYDDDGHDPLLIRRQKSFEDYVTPSANSVSAKNNFRLFHMTQDLKYEKRVHEILAAASLYIEKYPHACPLMLQTLDLLTTTHYEVTLPKDLLRPPSFLPYCTWQAGPQITVCKDKSCSSPFRDPSLILTQIENPLPL